MTRIQNMQKIGDLPDYWWTLERYHAMIEAGVLTSADRVELLFGKIVPMSPVGINHAKCVKKINRHFHERFNDDFVVGVQDPVTLPENSEPEPDISLCRGPLSLYDNRHPHAEDIFLLIEVADSTLHTDREVKQFNYALAGIPEYWIINLFERKIEQYLQPDTEEGTYATVKIYAEKDEVDSPELGTFSAADLLP